MKEQRHIDLHLPQSWNNCTTDELEIIASAILEEQAAVGRYRPYMWERVKVHIVLSVNMISVLEPVGNSEVFLMRRGEEEPWPLSIGQLADLCERLNWITDEQADKLIFHFPYPTLDVRCKKEDGRAISHQPSAIIRLQGPPPLLDGYTWQEYRWLTDWMQAYMRHANAMAQSKREDVRRENQAALDNARNEFLAILFKPKKGTSDILHLTSDIFTAFDAVKWQVILFWWSSLMQQLANKFPRVFRSQAVGKRHKKDTPWDFYNRVTATIQKYIGGLSEQDVNSATYGTILQQLEMMADEAAEMEKMKRNR